LEIKPFPDKHLSLTHDYCCKDENNISLAKPHLIKRSLQLYPDPSFYNLDNAEEERRHKRNTQEKLTIELGVFLDVAAYRTFMPFFDNDIKKLHDIILAYVSNIQAKFHDPTLGVSIDISLVHLEIMKIQPANLPASEDYWEILHLFCEYAKTRNAPNDSDPRHWDVAIYLTGLKLYFNYDSDILKTPYTELCSIDTSCVVAEFGVPRKMSSGFSSSLIAVHEIGHA